MPKLFLFAIGGTGSRVVKALTMLLASGVSIENTESIIPIIVDPDSANGDLTRTVDILKLYRGIREKAYTSSSQFFKTKITSLDELGDAGYVSDTFKFDIDGVKEQLFKEFIGYSELDRNNRALASLLFSKANLDADMDVGFKGNPNIGSVVLNKFKDSDFFRKFAANFEQDDRIFIISSIFGGTGAAGFPLIVKNIRDAKHPIPHHHFLQNARIGAVTVLPYFGVEKNATTSIDSNTFVSKTKAALSYYARNMSGNHTLNALYYIGDQVSNDQKGADGANAQTNKAHFIELAAALSIIEFMGLSDTDLNTVNRKATNPKYFEFGLHQSSTSIRFSDLAKDTSDAISKPLTRFALFRAFMAKHYAELQHQRGEAWAQHGNNKLVEDNIDRRLLNSITSFNEHFRTWLDEMNASNVSFSAINTEADGKDILNLVAGNGETYNALERIRNGVGLNFYRQVLSKVEPAFDNLDANKKLFAVFSGATKAIVDERIKI